jgi:thiamine-monophosphate kinase
VSEFELIRRYFMPTTFRNAGIRVGVGDDAAVVSVPDGVDWVCCVDTLVAGVHFPAQASPYSIGWKSLAVNLSDIAAMGARPAWATLALTLPDGNEPWIQAFMQGFNALAEEHGVDLIGGDTTRGPLTITVNLNGIVSRHQATRRCCAQPGDWIFVSGTLGDAGAGLASVMNQVTFAGSDARAYVEARLHQPTPRVALGQALRGVASAAIDISDGLLSDVSHILQASGVGATLDLEKLPQSPVLRSVADKEQVLRWSLSAGDDYELCFTVPERAMMSVHKIASLHNVPCSIIGRVDAEAGLRLRQHGQLIDWREPRGFDHFHAP